MGAKTRARGDPKAGASCKGFSHNFVKIDGQYLIPQSALVIQEFLRANTLNYVEFLINIVKLF